MSKISIWLAVAAWSFLCVSNCAEGTDATREALRDAIAKRQQPVIAKLLAEGADVNALDSEGRTPLFHASFVGDIQIVTMFLEKGADLKAKSNWRGIGLSLARSNSDYDVEMLELFMSRTGKDGGAGRGLTALHGAVAAYSADVVKLLLARGMEADTRDADGNTPLIWASLRGSQGSGDYLVARGADLNARNAGGLTPLHAASALGYTGTQNWLLDRGASVNARDGAGWTPLNWARMLRRDWAVAELIKRGASSATKEPNEIGVEDHVLLQRLERLRLPLTARALGYRDNEEALRVILRLRDGPLLEAYLHFGYTSGSKFGMTRTKFDLLRPLLAESWVTEPTKTTLGLWMANISLPGIEAALLETLDLVPMTTRSGIEDQLAARQFEPVLPHLINRLDAPGYFSSCKSLALLGSAAAMPPLIRCLGKMTETGTRGHFDVLSALAKHRGTVKIDFPALRRALPQTLDEMTALRYYELVGLHQDESQLPELLAALRDSTSAPGRAAREAVLRFESTTATTSIMQEFERLYASGALDKPTYDSVTRRISDRRAFGSNKTQADTAYSYERDKNEAERYKRAAEVSRDARPAQFAREYEEYIATLSALKPKYEGTPYAKGIVDTVAREYSMLGNFVRFKLKQPQQALGLFEKAVGTQLPSQDDFRLIDVLQMADTYQFDLGDRNKAVESYELARNLTANDTRPRSELAEEQDRWFGGWLTHEIQYLRTGKRFTGTIDAADLSGFGTVLFSGTAAETIGDPSFRSRLEDIDRLSPSRFNFLRAALSLSLLPDEKSVRRFLNKHDPSGYWSACFAGALLRLESLLAGEEKRREERHREERDPFVAMVKDSSGKQTPVMSVARVIAKEHRITFPSPDTRMATPEKTWQLFIASLRAGDPKAALGCFTSNMRSKLEMLFSKMTTEDMRRMAESFTAFSMQEGDGDMREAVLVRTIGERKNAGFAYFVRQSGEWRIDSM